jgi:hypothetical protein
MNHFQVILLIHLLDKQLELLPRELAGGEVILDPDLLSARPADHQQHHQPSHQPNSAHMSVVVGLFNSAAK